MADPADSSASRERLVLAVQTNCHIADARHAGDLTLCTYLLQMREFFRWERGLPFGCALARDEIGAWIAAREALWARFEEQPFAGIPVVPGCSEFDPFDSDEINMHLHPQGLLYGAGLVAPGRPAFFLAHLHGRSEREGLDVLTAGHELARGLLAPPAALGGGARGPVVLRRESLARWCWEKFEAFNVRHTPGSAMHAVVRAYGLDRAFEAGLSLWVDEQVEAALLHELGEHRVGAMLGPGWTQMRLALPSRRSDLYARAVRDQLADLQVTLPTLLERQAERSLHVWFASYDGVRRALFPSLETAYAAWRRGDEGRTLHLAVARGSVHFAALAHRVLELHTRDGAGAGIAIERLLTAPDAVCPDDVA